MGIFNELENMKPQDQNTTIINLLNQLLGLCHILMNIIKLFGQIRLLK